MAAVIINHAAASVRQGGPIRFWRRWVFAGVFLILGVMLLALAWVDPLARMGIFYNETASEPVGFYRMDKLGRLHDGEIIRFCPDPSLPIMALAKRHGWLAPGPCPGDLAPFLKTIVATQGQEVSLTAKGLCVNGKCLPHSAPKARSWTGKTPLPHYHFGHYRVQRGGVWVYGTLSSWSLDSRYYGPVPTHRLLSSARPMLTFR